MEARHPHEEGEEQEHEDEELEDSTQGAIDVQQEDVVQEVCVQVEDPLQDTGGDAEDTGNVRADPPTIGPDPTPKAQS